MPIHGRPLDQGPLLPNLERRIEYDQLRKQLERWHAPLYRTHLTELLLALARYMETGEEHVLINKAEIRTAEILLSYDPAELAFDEDDPYANSFSLAFMQAGEDITKQKAIEMLERIYLVAHQNAPSKPVGIDQALVRVVHPESTRPRILPILKIVPKEDDPS